MEVGASNPRDVLLAFRALARAGKDGIVRIIRGMAAAIVVGGGLIVSGQSFALCSLPPGSTSPGVDPSGETGAAPEPVPQPHVRSPKPVPSYSASNATNGPGVNSVGNGAGTASYANAQVVVAPTQRAATDRAEWCRRGGRSRASMDACLRSVLDR